ncbi:aminoglycoside phosphotransferase family protein [Paenibacillus chondroitinus]|uniref:Aminoglycoside phosphotransferase family protein n=1 Tax=Paenibacillus chondroitinus TaxID=59842 RepID=A0ABU6D8K1_9BACL|nr:MULTISPECIES: aminoglycoside phosphotransferase family protein [Paenibacillus]MCY9659736.1 phosphotransferase [Paenibacillus anseongense]MEB4794085.1 aminoglycoside phosphotransferase family protein [Paenibacillus chondroitinus]
MKRIAEGRTAEIFQEHHESVIKLYRSGFPKDAIIYEYEITKQVASLGISVPMVHELVEMEGRIGINFEYIEGKPLLQKMAEHPQELDDFAEILAEMHVTLHRCEVPADERGKPFRKQKEMLAHNIHQAPQLSTDEKHAILQILEALPNGNRVCHGDFHPDNAMVGEKRWIIDWMTGMVGHPAGDIARTLILFRYGTLPEAAPSHVKDQLQAMRERMGHVYFNYYLAHSNLQMDEIDQWMLPVAAARLTEWIPEEEKDQLRSVIRERLKLK